MKTENNVVHKTGCVVYQWQRERYDLQPHIDVDQYQSVSIDTIECECEILELWLVWQVRCESTVENIRPEKNSTKIF